MRIRFISLFVALVVSVTALVLAQSGPTEQMLEAAKRKEVVDGDFAGAIKQYQAIVDKYAKTDRAAAAMTLLRMAEAYQKLGNARAQKIYERIVKEYPCAVAPGRNSRASRAVFDD